MTAAAPEAPRGLYRTYVLCLLTAVYTFNFVDRQIMSILGPAIKKDLGLSDGELGILIGFVFAIFYTTLGIPVARIADRAHRVTVISASLAIWSGFTAVSGMAHSFLHLALARVGVGIGEAGGSPPAHSLISDLYPKEERAKALAVYAMGIPIGVTLAYLGAGLVLTQFTWRTTFFVVGLPGVILAILVQLTVKEPKRGQLDGLHRAAEFDPALVEGPRGPIEGLFNGLFAVLPESLRKAAFGEVAVLLRAGRHLLSIPSYRWVIAGLTAGSYASYAVGGFIVPFFRRLHPDVPLMHVLFGLGIISGTAYVLGVFAGGSLVDSQAKKSKAAYGSIPALAVALAIPALLGSLWVPNGYVALVLCWPFQLLIGFYLGPCFALAQTLAPVSIRALSTAIFFFILNLIALGLGPTITGFLSDAFGGSFGAGMGLRLAMSSVVVALLLSIYFFVRLTRTVERDWAEATATPPENT